MKEIKEESVHLSIVSPVYMAEKIVPELVRQLHENLSGITNDYEIILVNDASPDNSWLAMKVECEKDKRVKGINLSRNFGQHYAITAGLNYAKGEWVIVMDCDLQDRPDEIPNLYAKTQEGWDIILGRRIERKDSLIKKGMNYFFYKLLHYLTDYDTDKAIGTFRIINRKVVDSYNQFNEHSRYFGGLINWLGFKTATISVKHADRYEGKTSYSLGKLLSLSLNAILSFSDKPLRITIKLGFWIVFLSSLFILYKIFTVIFYGTTILGWSSLIASIFFSTGLIVSILGVIGLYIGKIFEETKNRPLYIVSETKNF